MNGAPLPATERARRKGSALMKLRFTLQVSILSGGKVGAVKNRSVLGRLVKQRKRLAILSKRNYWGISVTKIIENSLAALAWCLLSASVIFHGNPDSRTCATLLLSAMFLAVGLDWDLRHTSKDAAASKERNKIGSGSTKSRQATPTRKR